MKRKADVCPHTHEMEGRSAVIMKARRAGWRLGCGWRGTAAESAAVRRRAALLLQLCCCCCFFFLLGSPTPMPAAAMTLSSALPFPADSSTGSSGSSAVYPEPQTSLTISPAADAVLNSVFFRCGSASLSSSAYLRSSSCCPHAAAAAVAASPGLHRLPQSARGPASAAAAPAAFLQTLLRPVASHRSNSSDYARRRCWEDAPPLLLYAMPSLGRRVANAAPGSRSISSSRTAAAAAGRDNRAAAESSPRAATAGNGNPVGFLLRTRAGGQVANLQPHPHATAAAAACSAATAALSSSPSSCRSSSSSPFSSSSSSLASSASSVAPSSATEDTKFCDFAAQRVALFPGQGAQCLGMGVNAARSSAAARELFSTASEVVGRDLLLLCSEGPEAELHQTAWAQPALLTASMAAVARWREQQQQAEKDADSSICSSNSEPTACVGLSLGEYTALCFAGSLSFADAVKLTRLRGLSMQQAAEKHGGGMAAVLGLPRTALEQLCAVVRDEVDAERAAETAAAAATAGRASETAAGGAAVTDRGAEQQQQDASLQDSSRRKCVLAVANYLCPGNYTVSGEKAALARLEELALRGRRSPASAAAGGSQSQTGAAGNGGLPLQQRAKRFLPLRVSGAFHSALMGEAAAALEEALSSTPLQPPRIPVLFNVDAQTHSAPPVIKEKLMLQLTSPVLMEESLRTLLARGMQQGFEFGPGNVLSNLIKKIQPEGVDLQQIP